MTGKRATGGASAGPARDRADMYRCLERRLACENPRFEVFFDKLEAPDGSIVDDFLIVRPRAQTPDGIGGICILPEVDGKVGLMGSFRHQLNETVWQAPAGFMEPGESPQVAARRELREEVNLDCAPDDLVSLGTILPDAGLVEARVALFVARRCQLIAGDRDREPGTGLLTWFAPDDLRQLVRADESVGAASVVAAARYLELLADQRSFEGKRNRSKYPFGPRSFL